MNLGKIQENIITHSREYREGERVTIQVAIDADVSKSKNDIDYLCIKLKDWDLFDKDDKKIEISKESLTQINKGMPQLFTFLLDMTLEVVQAPLGKLTNLRN